MVANVFSLFSSQPSQMVKLRKVAKNIAERGAQVVMRIAEYSAVTLAKNDPESTIATGSRPNVNQFLQ